MEHTPLSPIYLSPLLWLIIILTTTYVNFRFLPHVTVAYYLGMALSLVRIVANIHNPINEQEAREQIKRYYKKRPTAQSFKQWSDQKTQEMVDAMNERPAQEK